MAGENGIVSGMAGRYATALFELALESKAIEQVQGDLKSFDALIAESPDLARLVRSPVFSADEQTKALVAILDKAGIKGIAANFLRVVAKNRRLFAVSEIDPRLQRAGRQAQGRSDRAGHRRRETQRRAHERNP